MKNVIIIICISIFFISLTSAQIIISPNPLNSTTIIGKQINHTITINNTYNFDVFNFTFGNLTDLGFTFPNVYVEANTKKTYTISVNPSQSKTQNLENNIRFHYHANIPEEVTTYDVLITDNGFIPRFITIREGDTIKWINQDDIVHTVFSQFFNEQIEVNQSYSYTFNQKGTFNYQDPFWDEFFNFNGEVNVINRTSAEEVYNPNYDFKWTTNLKYTLNPTELELTWFEDNFEVGATSQTEGSVRIKNIGNETAENIYLSANSEWIQFQENNFSLEEDSNNFVEYKLIPVIFETDATNKSYKIDLFVEGSNTQRYNKSINVFIPYREITEDFGSSENFLLWFENVFCPAHPTNYFCNPNQTVIIEGNGTLNQTVPINVSATDFKEIKDYIANLLTTQIRQGNDLQQIDDRNKIVEGLNKTLFDYVLKEEANERKNKAIVITIWVIIPIAIIGLVIIWLLLYNSKIRKKSALVEGQYKHKWQS